MSHVSDCKQAALLDAVGGTNTNIDDLESLWLASQGATSKHVNDQWLEVFKLKGATSDNWNTAALQALQITGFTGDNLADAWNWLWCDFEGGGGFCYIQITHTIESDTVYVQFDFPATTADSSGYTVNVNGADTPILGFTWDGAKILSLEIAPTTIGDKIIVSYDGAGNTLKDGKQLCTFTDVLVTDLADGDYAWAAVGSLYMLSDGDLNTSEVHHELHDQFIGKGAPAFTVPNDLMLPDFEGLHHPTKGGTAPWYGSRLADNLAIQSGDLQNSAWALSNITKGANVVDPDGGMKAITITATAVNGIIFQNIVGFTDTDDMINSFWIRRRSGVGDVNLVRPDAVSHLVTITNDWQRFSVEGKAGEARGRVGIRVATIDDEIDIAFPQAEDANGRSNLISPSVYIETTTIPIVKRYSNYNGNTVLNNVVTEAVGAPLAELPSMFVAPAGTWATPHGDVVVDAAIQTKFDIANHADGQGAYYCEVMPFSLFDNVAMISMGNTGRIIYSRTDQIRSYDGTTIVTAPSSTLVAGVSTKLGMYYGEGQFGVNYEGGASADLSYVGSFGKQQLSINLLGQTNGAANNVAALLIRNVRRYNYPTYAENKAKIDELMALAFINLLNPSENFDDAAWGKAGISIVSASTTPPAVAATADTLNGITTSQAGLSQQKFLFAGKRYSLSIYAKQGTSQYLGINPDAAIFGGGSWAIFNLVTGLVETTGGGGTSPVISMTDEGDGWYRCEWSAIADASGNSLIPYAPSSATSPLVLAGSQIFVAAAQLSINGLQPYEQRL